jgi:hypothetical protein
MIKGLRFITIAAIAANVLLWAIDPISAVSFVAQRPNSTIEVLVEGTGPYQKAAADQRDAIAQFAGGLTGCPSPPAGSACEVGATGPTILLVEM